MKTPTTDPTTSPPAIIGLCLPVLIVSGIALMNDVTLQQWIGGLLVACPIGWALGAILQAFINDNHSGYSDMM